MRRKNKVYSQHQINNTRILSYFMAARAPLERGLTCSQIILDGAAAALSGELKFIYKHMYLHAITCARFVRIRSCLHRNERESLFSYKINSPNCCNSINYLLFELIAATHKKYSVRSALVRIVSVEIRIIHFPTLLKIFASASVSSRH